MDTATSNTSESPRTYRSNSRTLLLAGLLAIAACGPSTIGDVDGGDTADADNRADARPGFPDASPYDAAPPPENAAVFAHSSSALYRVDPDTLEVTLIGNFVWPNGNDSMTDIAIDQNGRMIGVSFGSVYEVDEETAACTFLADISSGNFNGLSFVQAGPDPNTEILIGADLNGDVHEVDPVTGQTTIIGNYGNGLVSSGDIVSVRGAGTFATVTNGGLTDFLARIDPGNGYRATVVGDTGYDSIWGLGYWGSQVYGFSDNNDFLLIDFNTGAAQVAETGSVSWWGAGVTTTAPVVE